MRAFVPFLIAAASAGCGAHFPRPFLADVMVSIGTGAALADYLTQENASPEVCDRQSRGPHMGLMKQEDLRSLTAGLVDGTIPVTTWSQCANALLKTPPSEESAQFFDTMGKAYEKLLRNSDLETKPELQARVDALHQIFILRPHGLEPHSEVMTELLSDLEKGKAGGKLGHFAGEHGEDLLATVELGRDRWRGAPVTPATLDELQAHGDEALLRRFALRLASAPLQVEARRRVIRMHIAASKWPEVTGHAKEVEEAVLRDGRFPVDIAQHSPVRGSLDAARLPVRGLLIRQNVAEQLVTLLAEEGAHAAGSRGKLFPELLLRGPLQIMLTGLSGLVSVCAPAEELDVTPCILAKDIHVKTPFVDLDDGGRLHFIEHAHTADIFNEIYDKPKVSWAVEVGHTKAFTLDWPVAIEKPDDVVMTGAPGGLGPNMLVAAAERSERLFFQVDIGKGPLLVAIEKQDAVSFGIVTRGARGATGATGSAGSNGSSGSSGSSGSCGSSGGPGGNGTAGGNGGPGGPGGPGGNGGDVLVKVACAGAECQRLGKLLEVVIRSEGGPGGAGGAGGPGGHGGSGGAGGSGTSCTDSSGHTSYGSSGSSGSSGSNGSSGPRGPDGPAGKSGKVVFGTVGR